MTVRNGNQRLSERRLNAVWLIAGLLLSVTLLLTANWEANRQEQVRMDAFRSRIADLAKISESIINAQLRQFDDILLVLRGVYATDPKRFIEHIGLLRNGPLADREILVVRMDRDGYLMYTDTPNMKPRIYLGDRKYFRFFADGGKDRLYLDEPSFGRVTQRYSIPIARPIYDKKGAFLGVIALSVRQDSLADFGPRLQLSGDTAVTLVMHSGAVAGRSRDLAKMQGKMIPQEMLSPMLKGKEGVFSSRVIPDGVERVVVYRHIHDVSTPLIVYVEASPGSVLHDTSQQRFVLIGGAAFISLVIMVLIVVYLKSRKTTAHLIDTLRRSKEQEYKTITQTTLDGFLITDSAGRIVDTNDTFFKMLGYTREELLRFSIMDFEAVESPEQIAVHIRTAMEAGIARFQSRYRRKDGTIIAVEISAQYVKESSGRFFVFVRDITQQKGVEDALRNSEAQLLAILNATPFPIALVDVQDNKINFWSHSALTLFGHTAPTAPEWYQIAYPDPDYQREVIDRWKPFLEIARKSHQTVNTGEYRVTCSDGSARICELYVTFLTDKLMVTFNDITQRKGAEAALSQQTEELRASNDELDIFNSAATGRELRMIELKEEINELCRRLGEPPRHETDPLETDNIPGADPAPAPPGGGDA